MKYIKQQHALQKNNINPLYYESDSDKERYIFLKHEKILLNLPHFHESLEFVFILKGEATGHIANESHHLTEGDLFFCNKFKPHYYDSYDKNHIEAICLILGKDYCHHLFKQYPNTCFHSIMTDKRKNERIFALLETWLNKQNISYLTNCAYANLFFEALIREYGLLYSDTQQTDNRAIDFINYINAHYNEDLTLSSMAKIFGYTKEYFSSLFNKLIGQTFSKFLNQIRIQKAVDMIGTKTNEESIANIAYTCGYKNLTTFYRHYNDYKKNF